MIAVYCQRCSAELMQPGAVAFSPPEDKICGKYHICCECWAQVQPWLVGWGKIVRES